MHSETTPANEHHENAPSGDTQPASSITDLHADQDGRNREWEDRARVNLERVPEGTKTNLERDFEPENIDGEKNKNPGPAY